MKVREIGDRVFVAWWNPVLNIYDVKQGFIKFVDTRAYLNNRNGRFENQHIYFVEFHDRVYDEWYVEEMVLSTYPEAEIKIKALNLDPEWLKVKVEEQRSDRRGRNYLYAMLRTMRQVLREILPESEADIFYSVISDRARLQE